jgi:hypothetical protein
MAAANQKAPQPLSLNTKLEMLHREAPRGDLQKFMDRGDHGLHETGHRFVAVNHIETKLLTCYAIMFAPLHSQILYPLALCFALHLQISGSSTLALF